MKGPQQTKHLNSYYEVVPNDEGGWEVRKQSEGKPLFKSLQKQAAIHFAESLCKQDAADLIIYRSDGSIENQRKASDFRHKPSNEVLPSTQK
jgi:hypothetical protein